MNAKRATLRLYVAITGLLASLFELTGAFVRLATACLELASRRLQRGTPVPVAACVAPTAAPKTIAMASDERLVSALCSMKFPTAKVRAFVASVGGRQAPLDVLLKEGIIALTSSN